ncbi:MAG: hypothetical protein ACE5EL_02190 [Anaerolineae bacterium]
MPDFSTCRRGWGRAGEPGQWTHAGPVALADVLWWLDSVAEPRPAPPPAIVDGHSLVTAYPNFGPPWDDHAADNVAPLVNDLAHLANTDGRRGHPARGTDWTALWEGAREYLRRRGLAGEYEVRGGAGWRPAEVEAALADGAGAVLLLGVWEPHADGGPRRVGGHYAALAGADLEPGDTALVALSDPLADAAQTSGGRSVPDDPEIHSCREAPLAHDDPGVVSQDVYALADTGLPGSPPELEGYFAPQSYGEAAAFAGMNSAAFVAAFNGQWTGGAVVMTIDALMFVSPVPAPPTATPTGETPGPPGTPSASPPPTATATSTPAEATPTAAIRQEGGRVMLPFAVAGP